MDSGFGIRKKKVSKKDGMWIKSGLQSATLKKIPQSHQKGVTNMMANDIVFMKKYTCVGPSFSKNTGENVALRIIEDEIAVSLGPAFWPRP